MRRTAPDRYELRPAEAAATATAMARLRGAVPSAEGAAVVDAAHVLNGLLPEGLLRVLADFRRFGNDAGILTVRNLPVDSGLPPTPCVPDSVARECVPSVAALLLVMSRLGDPISYAEEKRGALVQDVCPVPGEEDQQQNTGAVYFKLHTENAFHSGRPDFVGLLCLRADHERRGASITSSLREALPHLGRAELEVLREPRFRTRLAPSFCRGSAVRAFLPPAPVVTGSADRPLLCVDFDDTRPLDDGAARALTALHDALQRVRRESVLLPGDLVVIDNSIAVHGRGAFVPRYDGRDRWLQRIFVVGSVRHVLDQVEAESIYRCKALHAANHA